MSRKDSQVWDPDAQVPTVRAALGKLGSKMVPSKSVVFALWDPPESTEQFHAPPKYTTGQATPQRIFSVLEQGSKPKLKEPPSVSKGVFHPGKHVQVLVC